MLFRAAHACGQILQTIHVEPTTAIAGWENTLSPLQLLHAGNHFHFEWTAIILLHIVGLGRRQ
jgi:hypothetical protein